MITNLVIDNISSEIVKYDGIEIAIGGSLTIYDSTYDDISTDVLWNIETFYINSYINLTTKLIIYNTEKLVFKVTDSNGEVQVNEANFIKIMKEVQTKYQHSITSVTDILDVNFVKNGTNDGKTLVYQNSTKTFIPTDLTATGGGVIGNSLYVAINGSDIAGDGSLSKPYLSLEKAMSVITDASPTNPYVIRATAGVFQLTTTLVVKENVHIMGFGDSTIITTLDNNNVMLNLLHNSDLSDLTLTGPTIGKVISVTTHNAVISLRNIKLLNCNSSIYVNALDCKLNIYSIQVRRNDAGITPVVLEILNGTLNIYSINIVGGIININKLFNVTGANSSIHVDNIDVDSFGLKNLITMNNNSYGIIRGGYAIFDETDKAVVNNGSYLNLSNIVLESADIGIEVSGVSQTLISNVYTRNSKLYDLNVLSNESFIAGGGNTIRDSLINFNGFNPQFILTHISNDEGDQSLLVKGELGVGCPETPSESCFGEGDSYTRGMLAYTYSTADGYTDITAEAKSFSGSQFSLPNTLPNSALYWTTSLKINMLPIKWYGYKIKIAQAGVVGTGEAVLEYWNGTTWTTPTFMRTDGNSPYLPRVRESFIESPANSYQVRLNPYIGEDWIANDPMGIGEDFYWLRFRIKSTITTSPVYEQFKIHSNRMEINGDGWPEYFGKARPIGRLNWNYGMLEPGDSSPNNQDIYLSDELEVGIQENLFVNGANDRVGLLSPLPFDLDVSSPIRFRFAISSNQAGGDNSTWTVKWGYVYEGGLVYKSTNTAPTIHPTEKSTTIDVLTPTTSDELHWAFVDLDLTNFNPRNSNGISDILFVTLEREDDAHNGNIALVSLSADYLKWTEGGHQ